MRMIDQKDLAEIVGHGEHDEYLKKEVKMASDGKQLLIRIPSKFVSLAGINKDKDLFEFTLVPNKDKLGEFTIEGKLIKR